MIMLHNDNAENGLNQIRFAGGRWRTRTSDLLGVSEFAPVHVRPKSSRFVPRVTTSRPASPHLFTSLLTSCVSKTVSSNG